MNEEAKAEEKPAVQPAITPEQAAEAIARDRTRRQKEFVSNYENLVKETQFQLVPQALVTPDGRIGVQLVVVEVSRDGQRS